MKQRTTAILAGLILGVLPLYGCGSSVSENTVESAGKIDEPLPEISKPPEETTAPISRIGIFLPSDSADERWREDAQILKEGFESNGYLADVFWADLDCVKQEAQIEEYRGQAPAAIVVAPADVFSMAQTLGAVRDDGTRIISYDRLIMDTDALRYFVTFDTRGTGKQIGKEPLRLTGLDNDAASGELPVSPLTIEFFMGEPGSLSDLYLFNGLMERLAPYLETGALVCRSGAVTFDQNCTVDWDTETALRRFDEIAASFYQDTGVPDIIVTATDEMAAAIADRAAQLGIEPRKGSWPVITGTGISPEAAKYVAAGRISFTAVADNRELAEKAVEVTVGILTDAELKGSTYQQYDNGVRIVRAMTCSSKVIDQENLQSLVEKGILQEEDLLPDPGLLIAEEAETGEAETEEAGEGLTGDAIPEIMEIQEPALSGDAATGEEPAP